MRTVQDLRNLGYNLLADEFMDHWKRDTRNVPRAESVINIDTLDGSCTEEGFWFWQRVGELTMEKVEYYYLGTAQGWLFQDPYDLFHRSILATNRLLWELEIKMNPSIAYQQAMAC